MDGAYEADMRVLRAMLPVKSAWKNGTVEAHTRCFPSRELFEFAFKDLLLCKEIILSGERQQLSGSWMRLAAVAACNKLDIRKLDFHGIGPDDVVEWLKREVPPQKKWREPKQIMIRDYGFIGFVDGLRAALETVSSMLRRCSLASAVYEGFRRSRRRAAPRRTRSTFAAIAGTTSSKCSSTRTHERLAIHAHDSRTSP